jgi:hypothetical protein
MSSSAAWGQLALAPRASPSDLGGTQGSGTSTAPSISSNGSRIAFQSTAAFAPGDSNGLSDVYVRDRSANTTTWAAAWAQEQGWTSRGANSSPSIPGDGRYVALALDSDVHVSDVNRARDIYEYDLATEGWAHISQDTARGPGLDASDAPSLSSDGTYAAFESLASNWDVDTNGARDVFSHEWVGAGDVSSGGAQPSDAASAGDEPAVPRQCELAKPALNGSSAPDVASSGDMSSDAPRESLGKRLLCRIRHISNRARRLARWHSRCVAANPPDPDAAAGCIRAAEGCANGDPVACASLAKCYYPYHQCVRNCVSSTSATTSKGVGLRRHHFREPILVPSGGFDSSFARGVDLRTYHS